MNEMGLLPSLLLPLAQSKDQSPRGIIMEPIGSINDDYEMGKLKVH